MKCFQCEDDDNPSRRLRGDVLTHDQALEQAMTLAREKRDGQKDGA